MLDMEQRRTIIGPSNGATLHGQQVNPELQNGKQYGPVIYRRTQKMKKLEQGKTWEKEKYLKILRRMEN